MAASAQSSARKRPGGNGGFAEEVINIGVKQAHGGRSSKEQSQKHRREAGKGAVNSGPTSNEGPSPSEQAHIQNVRSNADLPGEIDEQNVQVDLKGTGASFKLQSNLNVCSEATNDDAWNNKNFIA